MRFWKTSVSVLTDIRNCIQQIVGPEWMRTNIILADKYNHHNISMKSDLIAIDLQVPQTTKPTLESLYSDGHNVSRTKSNTVCYPDTEHRGCREYAGNAGATTSCSPPSSFHLLASSNTRHKFLPPFLWNLRLPTVFPPRFTVGSVCRIKNINK